MTDQTRQKVLLHVEDSISHREIVEDIAAELHLELIQFPTTDGVEAAIKAGGINFLLTDLHVGRSKQAGYDFAKLGVDCGIPWVVIASESESPSQSIENAAMMTKEQAYNALIAKVVRQEEIAEIWQKVKERHSSVFAREWNEALIRSESEI